MIAIEDFLDGNYLCIKLKELEYAPLSHFIELFPCALLMCMCAFRHVVS